MKRHPWMLPAALATGIAVAGGLLGLGWRGAAGLGGVLGLLFGFGEILDAARRQVSRRWR